MMLFKSLLKIIRRGNERACNATKSKSKIALVEHKKTRHHEHKAGVQVIT